MLWAVEVFAGFALAALLCRWPRPDRMFFQAVICCDVANQVLQFTLEHSGALYAAARVWRIGVLVEAALLVLALLEASGRHRTILTLWVCATWAAAWVRVFPITGTVLLLVNLGAFVAWIALTCYDKTTRRISSSSGT
jgi:hypothetical protein